MKIDYRALATNLINSNMVKVKKDNVRSDMSSILDFMQSDIDWLDYFLDYLIKFLPDGTKITITTQDDYLVIKL